MATLYVRDISDTIYQTAQQIAASKNQSLNAYVSELLQQAVEQEQAKLAAKAALERIIQRRNAAPKSKFDTTAVLRDFRDHPEL